MAGTGCGSALRAIASKSTRGQDHGSKPCTRPSGVREYFIYDPPSRPGRPGSFLRLQDGRYVEMTTELLPNGARGVRSETVLGRLCQHRRRPPLVRPRGRPRPGQLRREQRASDRDAVAPNASRRRTRRAKGPACRGRGRVAPRQVDDPTIHGSALGRPPRPRHRRYPRHRPIDRRSARGGRLPGLVLRPGRRARQHDRSELRARPRRARPSRRRDRRRRTCRVDRIERRGSRRHRHPRRQRRCAGEHRGSRRLAARASRPMCSAR